jgi:hypothetical protein
MLPVLSCPTCDGAAVKAGREEDERNCEAWREFGGLAGRWMIGAGSIRVTMSTSPLRKKSSRVRALAK